MPASVHRSKVARCVQHVLDKDKSGDKGKAIRICQASIGESYRIPKAERKLAKKGGKALKQLRKEQAKTKAAKLQARRDKMGWNSAADLVETFNGFCPTGKGGGRDNSCHGAGGKLNSKADERRRKLRRMFEKAKAYARQVLNPPKYKQVHTGTKVYVGKGFEIPHNLQVNDLIAILNSNPRGCNQYKKCSGGGGKSGADLEKAAKKAKTPEAYLAAEAAYKKEQNFKKSVQMRMKYNDLKTKDTFEAAWASDFLKRQRLGY